MGLGMFDTCDNSLMVSIFGPQRSRPFTQSVHSFVGAGFVAGILLSKPFLPEQKSPSGDVCPNHNLTEIGIRNDPYISPDDPPKEVLNPTAQNLCFFRKNARLLILKCMSKVTAPPKRNARCENIENSAEIEQKYWWSHVSTLTYKGTAYFVLRDPLFYPLYSFVDGRLEQVANLR